MAYYSNIEDKKSSYWYAAINTLYQIHPKPAWNNQLCGLFPTAQPSDSQSKTSLKLYRVYDDATTEILYSIVYYLSHNKYLN